ncbi:hypothetical protein B0H17DRAFT_1185108 [Mycena rosella]|uniref:Uncharacterized protein n=1 Tax=Mycena rosella TaxID=1033263 RepID=A0AAD7CT87_MYCRO|nr:hypothetical protein B0H17DRAFT_1185108 [Mycena rosella]
MYRGLNPSEHIFWRRRNADAELREGVVKETSREETWDSVGSWCSCAVGTLWPREAGIYVGPDWALIFFKQREKTGWRDIQPLSSRKPPARSSRIWTLGHLERMATFRPFRQGGDFIYTFAEEAEIAHGIQWSISSSGINSAAKLRWMEKLDSDNSGAEGTMGSPAATLHV